jgi:acyl-CoA thioesterase FadM
VETWLESVKSRVLTFAYRINRQEPDPALVATAQTTLIAMDAAARPRRLPDAILDRFRGVA